MDIREKVIRKIINVRSKVRMDVQLCNRQGGLLYNLKKRRNKCRLPNSIAKFEEKIKPLEECYEQLSRKIDRYQNAIERVHDFFRVYEDEEDFERIAEEYSKFDETFNKVFGGVIRMRIDLEMEKYRVI